MSTNSPVQPVVICWYRRALRIHDNPALRTAADTALRNSAALMHVYVLDHAKDPSLKHRNALRTNFLLETLRELDGRIQALGGDSLLVLQVSKSNTPQSSAELIVQLARTVRATDLVFEVETAPWANERDVAVCAALEGKDRNDDVQCSVTRLSGGHTLYDLNELLDASKTARPPMSMKSFQTLLADCGEPCEYASYRGLDNGHPTSEPNKIPAGTGLTPAGCSGVPSLVDLGMSLDGVKVRYTGGETVGLRRMEEFLGRSSGRDAAVFEKPNTSPAEFEDGRQETTVLSPYLAIGAISPRTLYHNVRAVQKKFKNVSQPPVSLIGQLLWREFFHLQMHDNSNFGQMEGNAICKQIPWDNSESAHERWKRWEAAETGFPWIDALMMQLKTEGFVHHLGRHSLACFLTRGDLWVSWELGARTFEKYLIDHDEALNAGNWMWLSASAFFSAYFRVYSPVAFGKRWSRAPDFIRHYLPVLKNVEDRYIFEPWTMPPGVAKKAEVCIGKDYPKPMLEHGIISKENISKMAAAYKAQGTASTDKRKRAGASGSGTVYKMRK